MKSARPKLVSMGAVLPLVVAAGAIGQTAVEWKVSDGGNGHWYQLVISGPITWQAARAASQSSGGYLVTATTASEEAFIAQLAARVRHPTAWVADQAVTAAGPWLGGYQPAGGTGSQPWAWVNGEPWNWTGWASGEPNGGVRPGEAWTCMLGYAGNNEYRGWADCTSTDLNSYPIPVSYITEWSADCNGDGIVDYGQILSGELADTNGNGVPDCCEDGSACVSSLVANPSFEAGSSLAACAKESITAPNSLGSAWQVSAGTVDRVRGGTACATSTQPKLGDYAVDLCGTPASSGAIRQIVATVPGHKYRCTFWLSGDASASPSTKKVHAKVGTYVDLSYTFVCSGSGAQIWESHQFEFTARGASEVLEFAADNGVTTGGPMLDAINLADITTQCVGDIDDSGDVDGGDISLLLLNFGPCPTAP